MSLAELGAIGEFVGGVSVIITLIYLAMQLRKNSQVAIAETYASSQSSNLQIEQLFIDLADVWVKLERGDSLTDAEEFQIGRAIEARHNSAFLSYARNRALNQGSHEIAIERFASFLVDNPHIRTRWRKYQEDMSSRRDLLGIGPGVTATGREWAQILDQYLELIEGEDNNQQPE